jgi:hypothetical protein
MLAATHSIRVEKRAIKLLDIVDTDLNMEDCYNNANEIIYGRLEHRCNIHDSLLKMRTHYLSNK